MSDGRWCNRISDTHEFFAYVLLSAPDDFPDDGERLDLDSAFDELRHGLAVSQNRIGTSPHFEQCVRQVDEAYRYYAAGEIARGANSLQMASQSFAAAAAAGGCDLDEMGTVIDDE
jgi:hypothetical protein